MLEPQYLHPSGQIPAYEWNFGDVNPPVHAWAAWYVYGQDKLLRGEGDVEFLKAIFQKLLMNFTWWVNRKDRDGQNVFEGGFLGLDNIGVFDRSAPHEYFHGDNGAGIGASHQTGWTGLVAALLKLFGTLDARAFLEQGGQALGAPVRPAPIRSRR
jgi:hypothetical protein